VVEPLVYGRSSGLSPIAIVISASFWTWLWGPIGLVLATPLTVCLVVIGRHVDRLRFLDVLLGNKPALTPPQLVYQRMLAGDPVEASQQAQTYLKDASLEDYYDTILLPGLRLAEADARLGRLDPDRVDRILATVTEVVDDLDSHEDRAPSQTPTADTRSDLARLEPAIEPGQATTPLLERWERPGAVLCLPGAGKLDEAAVVVLAQMLKRRGIGAAAETADALSMSRFFSLDLSPAAAFCICYVGKPSDAMIQYTVRRLSKKSKGGRIIIALLGNESDAVSPPTVDITTVVGDFASVVDAIVETAIENSRLTGASGADAGKAQFFGERTALTSSAVTAS
jgi:hypothetical protein